jgi:Acetyltransferase (GNAT) domain
MLTQEKEAVPATTVPEALPAVIAAKSVPPHLYDMPDFYNAWWANLACQFDIPVKNRDLLIYRRRILKGLFSLREVRIAGWNSAWNQDLTAERVAELQELGRSTAWDYCRLTWNENRKDLQAFDALKKTGFIVFQQPAPTEYVVDLHDGFEGYLKSLSHNGRKGLKKKVRRAEELQPKRVVFDKESDIEPFFAEFIPLHRSYWDDKAPGGSYFNRPDERRFIVEWCKALYRNGNLVLDRVIMGDKIVNLSMGVRLGDEFYWLLTINTGHYSDMGPGLIAMYLRVQELAAEGVTRFKMGSGDYFYKIQSANSQEACHDLIIVNPASIRGKLWLSWLQRQQKKAETEKADA